MISVTQERFYQILKDSKYERRLQKSFFEYTSCPYYNIVDTDDNDRIVGVYSDGSWENSFEVVIDFASKEDIVKHYEKLLKYSKDETERFKAVCKDLRTYKNSTAEERLVIDQIEHDEMQRRLSNTGLYTFLEDSNIHPYDDISVKELMKKLNN